MYRRNNTFAGRINELLQLASGCCPTVTTSRLFMQLSLRSIGGIGRTQLAVDVLSLWTLLQWGRVLAQLRRGKGCAGERWRRLVTSVACVFPLYGQVDVARQVGRVQQCGEEPVPAY